MTITALDDQIGDRAETADVVESWLGAFSKSMITRDAGGVEELFLTDAWWRDLLTLTWDFGTVHGTSEIAGLISDVGRTAYLSIGIDPDAAAPSRETTDPEGECILAFVLLRTTVGTGRGVLRLRQDTDGRWKAWILFTTLQDITGHEQARGERRPLRSPLNSSGSRENWHDLRQRQFNFSDTEPEVLIIGAGQGGLMTAAHLGFWGVGTLVIDRNAKVGDNWRSRYRSLVLHDAIWADHLPGLDFPDSWPVYLPKDKLGDWLEFYASAMELNVWSGTELLDSEYDDETGSWRVRVRRADGSERIISPRHVVFATGVHGTPKTPNIPGMNEYRGTIVHSSAYTGEEAPAGTRALVVGAGNSAHDVAQDLHKRGFEVTMIQRSSTYVISQKTNFELTIGRLYHEGGMRTEDADLLGSSIPFHLSLQRAVAQTAKAAEMDREMLDGLTHAGYRYDLGVDGAGAISKILNGPGGYYIDVGCAELIADGKIAMTHSGVGRFTSEGVVFEDGKSGSFDLVVLATGYTTMLDTARKVLGNEAADRCKKVWGLDENGEISGIWRPSGHPGLWFMGGPLYLGRFYSRFLALQLHASALELE